MADKIDNTIEPPIEDAVGSIAQIMAAKRAIETERSDSPAETLRDDRLFADPFAARLAGAELESLK